MGRTREVAEARSDMTSRDLSRRHQSSFSGDTQIYLLDFRGASSGLCLECWTTAAALVKSDNGGGSILISLTQSPSFNLFLSSLVLPALSRHTVMIPTEIRKPTTRERERDTRVRD